jgi:hypothetical protein
MTSPVLCSGDTSHKQNFPNITLALPSRQQDPRNSLILKFTVGFCDKNCLVYMSEENSGLLRSMLSQNTGSAGVQIVFACGVFFSYDKILISAM